MSRARLRELRLVGFKSFAERTVVQLGPGISAVVGPNGSGKSNLADALRWALGEQGRALRSRRAEDLIFAGSAQRRAQGMADVSLVIDNSDGLLAVDFGEVELARRLYRSGENEYLLNRQRIRLKDLVELLDDANIADNAFLFIGQGMVDQALALRPEERRPLFEEAAGIRKHQRRRVRAEAELDEAGTNLERVRDLLAELRPQVRRLTAQAEQQEARSAAGAELAAALVEAARARLATAAAESERHAAALVDARREADATQIALRDAEEAAVTLARALSDRADVEQQLRAHVDTTRAEVQGIELARARSASEAEAQARERARLAEERAAAAARADEARRRMAAVLPEEDRHAEEALEQAERRVAEADRDADELRRAGHADDARVAAARHARERLAADAERAARHSAEAARRRSDQAEALAGVTAQADAARQRATAAGEARGLAQAAEVQAEEEASASRAAAREVAAAAASAADAVARLRSELEGLVARQDALDGQLRDGLAEETVDSARAMGGRRFSDGLEVEPGLRIAVEAALGDALTGLLLDVDAARALADVSAVMVLREGAEPRGRSADGSVARLEARVGDVGGGWLADALRLDPDGQAGRLLSRSVWVPGLDDALDLRTLLPPGWRIVTRDGIVVDDVGVVRPAPGASLLERRAARDQIARRSERARTELAAAIALAEETATASRAADALEASGASALEAARRARRIADEAERSAADAAQNADRERAWQEAMLERLIRETDGAAAEAASLAAALARLDDHGSQAVDASSAQALATLDARLTELRTDRDRLDSAAREARAARERSLEERRRAEIGLGLAEARLEELGREAVALGGRQADLSASLERSAGALASAQARLGQAIEAFEASVATARAERADLLAMEAAAGAARERLRLAESRSRAAEVADIESRVLIDAAREGLLVELASIGPDGLMALLASAGHPAPASAPASDELPELLEAGLAAALVAWQQDAGAWPATDPSEIPSRARIMSLRRRFNEVGAGNPYAAEELGEVQARLTSLEAQRDDLERAIRETRELMGRLDSLMREQFGDTFRALEGAFARRFQQLFDGGEAQLSLTDAGDLSVTGVEITARPPGKRRQPLAMLSGGERALTAVALLLAMLEVRPVPFCVLDEVDAALDEANVGRFSAALRSLAQDIQFVVITHNRGTIEAADALYGVTVGDDAVSRVVSLRLADVPEEAAVASRAGA